MCIQIRMQKDSIRTLTSCSPCESSVDKENTKLTQLALNCQSSKCCIRLCTEVEEEEEEEEEEEDGGSISVLLYARMQRP